MMQGNKQNVSRASRVSKQTLCDVDPDNLQEYMQIHTYLRQILYSQQKQSQKQGRYMQAEAAKKKLVRVRAEVQKQRREQMLSRQDSEKAEVQMAHVEQVTEFNKYWDEKMAEFQEEALRIEDQILDRHQAEMEEFQREIEESLQFRQKDSSEALNLKKMEESLARDENYVEAHRIQKQVQQIERTEYQKWMGIRTKKIRNLLGQLRNKQQAEAGALRQRIEQGFEQQKKSRQQGYEKLVQKYSNFMKGLQNHHSKELTAFDKASKLQSNASFSKAASMSRALQSVQKN